MTLLILLVCMTAGLSFLCSILEATLLSITPVYVAQLEETKPALFKKISAYKTHIDTPLSAILTLNTLANIVGAAGIGAQVAVMYGSHAVAAASALMTVVLLFCSEIIPKTLGATHWKSFVPFLVFFLTILIFLFKPILKLSEILVKALDSKSQETSAVKDEIKALAKMGRAQKMIDEDEFRVIVNMLNLHEIRVKEITTPRNVCSTVLSGITVAGLMDTVTKVPFSRFPVMKDEEDETFVGYVHKADIIGKDPSVPISTVMRKIHEIASSAPLDAVFADMLKTHNHIGVVYDELGTWVGIVTMEDILETILGQEIIDETDKIIDMRSYAKMMWSNRQSKILNKEVG